MQKTTILTLSLLALALASPLGAATHSECTGVITALSAGSETLYIDDRSDGAATLNHWLYLESNGEEDLQSGGAAPYDGLLLVIDNFDPCSHSNPDTILF